MADQVLKIGQELVVGLGRERFAVPLPQEVVLDEDHVLLSVEGKAVPWSLDALVDPVLSRRREVGVYRVDEARHLLLLDLNHTIEVDDFQLDLQPILLSRDLVPQREPGAHDDVLQLDD